jgi:HlyD family secretion protein
LSKRLLTLLLLVPAAALAYWVYLRQTAPPEAPFTRATRETLVSTLSTNGRVEPLDWRSVRVERPGLVTQVHVTLGQQVAEGAPIATLEAQEARAELTAAESRLAQARADLQGLETGGRSAELAEIENNLSKVQMELESARREAETLGRLREKQAATGMEVRQAQELVRALEEETRALENRRRALVGRTDLDAARARLRDAEAALTLARQRLAGTQVRAPMTGVVYELPVRAGSYLNPGEEVARVGRLDQLRVVIFVDEPELGRVASGMPVRITWDALPDRSWEGFVKAVPTQIVPFGSRQVGEVISVIENAGRDLLPGTNANAEIQTNLVKGALTIPRGALRTRENRFGVYSYEDGRITWRPIQIGVTSATRVEILGGLRQGDPVLVQTGQAVEPGTAVRPVYQ